MAQLMVHRRLAFAPRSAPFQIHDDSYVLRMMAEENRRRATAGEAVAAAAAAAAEAAAAAAVAATAAGGVSGAAPVAQLPADGVMPGSLVSQSQGTPMPFVSASAAAV